MRLTLSISENSKRKQGFRTLIEKMTKKKQNPKGRKTEEKTISHRNNDPEKFCNFSMTPLSKDFELKHSNEMDVCSSSASAVFLPKTGGSVRNYKHSLDTDEHYRDLQLKAMEFARKSIPQSFEERTGSKHFTMSGIEEHNQQNFNDCASSSDSTRKRKLSQMESNMDEEVVLSRTDQVTNRSGKWHRRKGKSHKNLKKSHSQGFQKHLSAASSQNVHKKQNFFPVSQDPKLTPNEFSNKEDRIDGEEMVMDISSQAKAKRPRLDNSVHGMYLHVDKAVIVKTYG